MDRGGMRMPFFHRLICGFLIGVGCILPGVSGGVMAVSFGLYRPALDALLTIFHQSGRKLRFLLPIALGGAAGLLLGAKWLLQLMTQHGDLMLFLFMGFILGGVPDLWREARCPVSRRIPWLMGGLICTLLFLLPGSPAGEASQLSPLQSLLTGLLEGVGTIVPGVSTSMVLIRLGWYGAYLDMLSALHMPQLLWMAAGFALMALLCMHAVRWLFAHSSDESYSAVLGFLLGSVALVFPGFSSFPKFLAQLSLIIIGAVLVHWLNHIPLQRGES